MTKMKFKNFNFHAALALLHQHPETVITRIFRTQQCRCILVCSGTDGPGLNHMLSQLADSVKQRPIHANTYFGVLGVDTSYHFNAQ